jgi:hypothetical protein
VLDLEKIRKLTNKIPAVIKDSDFKIENADEEFLKKVLE